MERRDGFTMVEMLVVVLIILVIAGLSLAAFSTLFRNRGVSGSARLVENVFRNAHQQTTTKRRSMLVVFTTDRTLFVGYDPDTGEKKTSTGDLQLIGVIDSDGNDNHKPDEDDKNGVFGEPLFNADEDDKLVMTVELPPNQRIEKGEGRGQTGIPYVVFHPDGRAQVTDAPNGKVNWDVSSSDFRADPRANHDFKLVFPDGEAVYFDVVTATGRISSADATDVQ